MNWLEIKNNRVTNVIVWNGTDPYDPPGVKLIRCDDLPGVGMGWTRDADGVWVAPAPVMEDGESSDVD